METKADLDFLKITLEDFVAKTRSKVAASILADWKTEQAHFIKVIVVLFLKCIYKKTNICTTGLS